MTLKGSVAMLKIGKCSADKLKFMYKTTISERDFVNKAPELNGVPRIGREENGVTFYNSPDSDYDNGMDVYKATNIENIDRLGYETNIEIVYLVDDILVTGAKREHTLYFVQNGIQTVMLSDGKETLVISKNDGILLHRKSGSRMKILEKLILGELKDTDKVEYIDGLVKTKNFTGTYKEIDDTYRIIKIHALTNSELYYNRFYYNKVGFEAILNKKDNTIVNDSLYAEVKHLGEHEEHHHYRTRIAENSEDMVGLYSCVKNTRSHESLLIDLKNNRRHILDNVYLYFASRYLIVQKRLGKGNESVTVYRFDKDRRVLITVIPEILNAYAKENRLRRMKKENENIAIMNTTKGYKERDKERNKDVTRVLARIFLNRQGNGDDFVEWYDMLEYEKAKLEFYKEI